MCVAMSALLLLCSCARSEVQNTSETDYPLAICDTVISNCPQKVISLSPALTDIVCALGSDAQLCGVSDLCVTDRELPTFGSSVMPNTDGIIQSGAEVVLCTGAISGEDMQTLTDAGIAVAVVQLPTDFEQLEQTYTIVAQIMSGAITGRMNAQYTFGRISARLSSIKSQISKRPTVLLLTECGTAAADGTLWADMLDFAGGKNAAKSVSVDDSAIIAANPEYIFAPKSECERIMNDSAFASLSAVVGGNVTELPHSILGSMGERMVSGVEIMAAAMHPDLFVIQ